MLGHHYQRDEVIQFADVTGDSFKLARDAAGAAGGGVHRVLRRPLHGRVRRHPHRRPSRSWCCPTSPPAARWPTWPGSRRSRTAGTPWPTPGIAESVVPITYMNSSADIKAFCGRNGGAVCTSSNADVALEWAFAQKPDAKVLFLPDQHLGRNTAVLKLGMTLDDCVVWDPRQPGGGVSPEELAAARMILWKGHCSVHGRFSADVVDELRAKQARHQDPGPPRVHPRRRHPRRPGRVDGVHHQDHRGRAGRVESGRSAPSSTSCSASPASTPSRRSPSSTATSATARR